MTEIMYNTLTTLQSDLPEETARKLCEFGAAVVKQNEVMNLTGITEATAEIRFVGLSIKEFTVDAANIKVVNVPNGLKYELMSEVVKVTLRGPVAKINQIKPENIVVTVDLTGKEVGATTVKGVISVRNEAEGNIGAVGAHTVSVTLTEMGG